MKTRIHTLPSSRGFSLVELLVVVGIMAAMLSVAAIGIQSIDKGQGTVSGLAQVQALMNEARSIAIGRGTRARLCIHSQPTEEDRNLSFMVVAFEEIERDDSGQETGRTWRVENRGTALPDGVYFHPVLSETASSQVNGLGSYGSGTGVRFPGDSRSTRQPPFFFYEFNSEGICTIADEGSTSSGAAFVLCRGVTGPSASAPRVIGNDIGGFVIWRNGRTSPIRDISSLTSSSQ